MNYFKQSLAGSLVASLVLFSLGSLGHAANQSQQILGVTASLSTWLPTIYRGHLNVSLDADKNIAQFTYTESFIDKKLVWSAPETSSYPLSEFQTGRTLMASSSNNAVIIKVKGANLDPVSGGAVDLIIARNTYTKDYRLVHLELTRDCSVCPFKVNVNDIQGRSVVDSLDIDAAISPDGVDGLYFKKGGHQVRAYNTKNLAKVGP